MVNSSKAKIRGFKNYFWKIFKKMILFTYAISHMNKNNH